ncbi:MAG: glucosyltransferase domain-containing protein [Lachnospiraceae bacterium]|nr:glucosyltransferase domain-containing protein [Lachnospiraceae bacterium]
MKWYQFDKKNIINYLLLSMLSFLYILPLVLINLYFKDDLGWSLRGSIGLKGDGRPLAEYLVLMLCGGEPVTDTAPLPLILAVLFLSYTLILYSKANLDFISNRCGLLTILLLIITNPFALECLSYRYGSMVMVVALGIPFLIFSMPDAMSKGKLFVYSSLLSIALMSLYQPALGMCLVLFIVNIFLVLFQERKANYGLEVLRMIGIGAGAIVYKLIIAEHYVSQSDWRFSASQTLELRPGSIIAIFQNIFATCNYIIEFLAETSLWYRVVLLLFVLLTMFVSVAFYCDKNEKRGGRKAIDIAFLLLSPVCILISSFLPLMILRQQTLKLRIFIALGGFLFYLGILLLHFTKKHPTFFRPLLLLLILCNLYHYTCIYSYGNAVNNHNEYAKYLVYHIVHDIEIINADEEFTRISFIGEMPKSQRTQIFCDKYPLTGALLPQYITNDGWIGGAYVLHYLQNSLDIETDTDEDRQIAGSAEPVMANSIYSCYTNADKIIVVFN